LGLNLSKTKEHRGTKMRKNEKEIQILRKNSLKILKSYQISPQDRLARRCPYRDILQRLREIKREILA
jgi:hypothetical protein